MPSRFTYEPGRGRDPKRLLGYVGDDVLVCIIEQHRFNPDAIGLYTDLPTAAGVKHRQFDTVEQARNYFEKVVFPEFLKKSGLQFIPKRKPAKKPKA